MGREAIGGNGAVSGGGEYWSRVNRDTWFGGLMRQPSETAYWETLKEIGDRAAGAAEEIYEDLRKNEKRIQKIEASARTALAKQVRALYDVSRMAGTSCSHSGECESLLNLSGFLVWSNAFGNERAVQAAVWRARNHPECSAGECMELIKRAAEWGIGYAAGGSGKKRAFLEEISQGQGTGFFEEVIEAYESSEEPEARGSCGYAIGGSEYLTHMERKVFLKELPAAHSARWGSPDYAGLLKDALESIARQLERDLERNERENNYITDETEQVLKLAAVELGRCGAGIGSLGGKIERLSWFVGGDPGKIRQLQQKLNQLGVGEHLTEDGVYGKKTLAAWEKFLSRLEHGTVPTLAWIDPLQSKLTGIEIGSTTEGSALGLNNALISSSSQRFVHIDGPHSGETLKIPGVRKRKPINFNHLNIDKVPNGNWIYNQLQSRFNHHELSDDAYNALKDLKATGKKVRIAGKVLLVAGIALDALELGTTIDADLKDADRKLGKKTLSAAASIGGSWAGAALGAKLGALAGAATGPAAPIAVPVLGLVGGIGGAFGGDALGKWVVDITCEEDWTWG